MTAARGMAEDPESGELDQLLARLSLPLPLEEEDAVQDRLSRFDPSLVMGALAGRFLQKSVTEDLLAGLAPVLARWTREAGNSEGDRVLQALLELTSETNPLLVRIAGIDALGVSESTHPTVRKNLELLRESPLEPIRTAAKDALDNLFG